MVDQSETAAKRKTDDASSGDTGASRKTAATKAPANKTAAKKRAGSSAKKATSADSDSRSSSGRGSRLNAVKIARSAKEQLAELLNKESETVIGVQRTEDGWEVDLEVVETRRIPDTTDVLAIYRVQLDDSGDIEGYQRLERYVRGKAEGGVAGG